MNASADGRNPYPGEASASAAPPPTGPLNEPLPLGDASGDLGRPLKISEMLADRLRASILGDGLAPGDLLSSEQELISRYGVARGTVREALRLLESEGLIEIRRGRSGGILVREPDLNQVSRSVGVWLAMRGTTMRQLLDFRLLIEPFAAEAAAMSATPEQRNWLIRIAEQPAEGGLIHAADLHDSIAVASNNDLCRVTAASLYHGFSWHMTEERLSASELEATHTAHLRIVRAIGEANPRKARHAMVRHLEDFGEQLENSGRIDDVIVPRSAWLRRAQIPRP
ncbi:MAG TPA: GntR family transcriptional regulator [Mycobacterium sp.]|nr:GntR family transcriptional regulator [Mycobacterium sp.]